MAALGFWSGFWSGMGITVFFALWFAVSLFMLTDSFSSEREAELGFWSIIVELAVVVLCLAWGLGFYIGRNH